MPPYKVRVNWQVAADPEFRTVVKAGSESATPELAHSVQAEVDGLPELARAKIVQDIADVEPLLRAGSTHELDTTRPLDQTVGALIAIAARN
ncbi:PhoD-like phosphatase N-terminal domain-containing protein [Arthrobacter sp. CG_A4]|uniref:PhoD-like phosphatase N-terminal domain-containing protein n=1 Tax=Arthrobacter sp. CG_A4 TaxID=3071706 RepID=UPI002E061742|nr:hypothetical protein [Arthrobacter sp. CG_A4]